MDCADLHFSFQDIRGAPGQLVARLTPLGWTCIGALGNSKQININTNFAHNYFSAGQTYMEKINLMLQKFWEVDISGIEQVPLLNTEDKLVLDMAEESIKHNACSYEIAIPWKESLLAYKIMLKWQRNDYIHNLERKLHKEPKIA